MLGISARTLRRKRADGSLKLKPVPWSDYRQMFLVADVDKLLRREQR